MTTLDQIKTTLAGLSNNELAALRDWLEELAEQRWDEQIESDAKAGKHDWLAEEALEDVKAGRTKDL
jgi:hypothetical protein